MRFACNVGLLMALVPVLASTINLDHIQNHNQIIQNLHPPNSPQIFINPYTDRLPFIVADGRVPQASHYEDVQKFNWFPKGGTNLNNNILADTFSLNNQQVAADYNAHLNTKRRIHQQTGSRENDNFSSSPQTQNIPVQLSYPTQGLTKHLLEEAQQESAGQGAASKIESLKEKSHATRKGLDSRGAKVELSRNIVTKKTPKEDNRAKKLKPGKEMVHQVVTSHKKQNTHEDSQQSDSQDSINNTGRCSSKVYGNKCRIFNKMNQVEDKKSSDDLATQSEQDNGNNNDSEIPDSDSSSNSDKISDAENKSKASAEPKQDKVNPTKEKSEEKKTEQPKQVEQSKSAIKTPEAKVETKEHLEPSKPHHIELHAHQHFENHHHISLNTKLPHYKKKPRQPPLIHLTPDHSLGQHYEHEFKKPEQHVKEYQHYEPMVIHMNHKPNAIHGPHLENIVIEDHSELESYHQAPDVTYHEDVISHPHGHGMSPIGHNSFIHPMFHR